MSFFFLKAEVVTKTRILVINKEKRSEKILPRSEQQWQKLCVFQLFFVLFGFFPEH